MNTYTALVDRCPATGLYVGHVPGLPGAHAQGTSPEELHQNLRDVIRMLMKEDDRDPGPEVAITLDIASPTTGLTEATALKPSEIYRQLETRGFIVIGIILDPQRGSHMQFHHADRRCTTVPNNSERDISPVLLRLILEDIHVSREEFFLGT